MRILFAITKGEVGGAQRHLEIIADGLSGRGHDVAALVEQPSSLADRLVSGGVTVIGWDSIVRNPHPVRDLAARRQLKAAVEEFGPDILHIHSAKAGVLGRGILRPPDGVTIFTCHHASFGPGRKPSHRLIGRPVEQLSLRFVDGIISVGTRDMSLLGKLAGEAPLHLVRNAVPTVGPPRSPEALQKVALWVARLQHPKDPSIIIKAWERVVARHPTARLRICGTGPLSNHVQKLVAGSPVAANIDYLGFVDDLGQEYARASLFVLTTHVEGGTTMATLEAMSEGLVPVVTDAGDAFMLPSEHAGVMAHTSAKPVATAVSDLFDNPERVSRLRSNALSYARERFTPTTMVNGTIVAYEDILRRNGMAFDQPATAEPADFSVGV